MRRDLIIGIDAGTSVLKAVAFSISGHQLAVRSAPNAYVSGKAGRAEQNMARTWTEVATAIRTLLQDLPDLRHRVAAVGVTGQGDGLWLIDEAGAPVQPAWLWLDSRSSALADEIRRSDAGKLAYQRTGTALTGCKQSMQLAWLKAHDPTMLARATTALHCKDWLYFNLTGERATDPSEATYTYGDYRRRSYDEEVIAALGLGAQRALLPPIVDGAIQTHGLSHKASEAIGLDAGTPVALGYIDVVCTALGAGLYDRDAEVGCSIIGSTGAHMRLARTAQSVRLNAESTGETMAMPIEGAFLQMQSTMAASLNLDWFVDLARGILASAGVAKSRSDILSVFDASVMTADTAGLLYHPYISDAGERGPFVNSKARAQFTGLSKKHGFAELLRAVFEGVALAARDCYTAMGPIPKEIRVTGGASRSAPLRTILGAALDARIVTSAREETGAAGAAMIAAVGVGAQSSIDACVDQWVRPLLQPGDPPDRALAARYDRLFPAFQRIRKAMPPSWNALAKDFAGERPTRRRRSEAI